MGLNVILMILLFIIKQLGFINKFLCPYFFDVLYECFTSFLNSAYDFLLGIISFSLYLLLYCWSH